MWNSMFKNFQWTSTQVALSKWETDWNLLCIKQKSKKTGLLSIRSEQTYSLHRGTHRNNPISWMILYHWWSTRDHQTIHPGFCSNFCTKTTFFNRDEICCLGELIRCTQDKLVFLGQWFELNFSHEACDPIWCTLPRVKINTQKHTALWILHTQTFKGLLQTACVMSSLCGSLVLFEPGEG